MHNEQKIISKNVIQKRDHMKFEDLGDQILARLLSNP